MNMKLVPIAALTAALLCGCKSSEPKSFTEYHGTDIFQGTGGEEQTLDDIDFWSNGDPDRKYQIVGIIGDDSPHHHILLGPLNRLNRLFPASDNSDEMTAANAKIAHDRGGDAIVIVARDQPSSSTTDDDDLLDAPHHPRQTKLLVVVKYVQ